MSDSFETLSFQPRFVVRQKITPIVNKYQILKAGQGGADGESYSFAQQKRLKIKEKITFYTDESKTGPLFTLRAAKVLDIHGRYFVEDMDGNLIGGFRKDFKKSLILSTWRVFDASEAEKLVVREDNYATAILRRVAGEVTFLSVIMLFIKYHFEITDTNTQKTVGEYRKTTLMRDHYALNVADEAWSQIDERVFAALGVALDALQSR